MTFRSAPSLTQRTFQSIRQGLFSSTNGGCGQWRRHVSTTPKIHNSLKQEATPILRVRCTRQRYQYQCQQFRSKGHISASTAHARSKTGPISVISVALFVGTGVGLYFYFQYEKARMERKRIAEASKGIGKPKVGGVFELLDQNGKPWSSDKMKGKFSLVYFGFSHCPDICPEELDKMAVMLDLVEEKLPSSLPRNPDLMPIFITCDPARDTPAVLKTYLKEFHQKLIGLTGNWDQIKAVCKLYRVYFSTPPDVKPGQDYLVDHSIYFYLMDPEGDFVEAIGRQHSAEHAAKLISDHMADWKGGLVKG